MEWEEGRGESTSSLLLFFSSLLMAWYVYAIYPNTSCTYLGCGPTPYPPTPPLSMTTEDGGGQSQGERGRQNRHRGRSRGYGGGISRSLLVSFLQFTILNHPYLELSLAFHFTNSLSGPAMIKIHIMSLIKQALYMQLKF